MPPRAPQPARDPIPPYFDLFGWLGVHLYPHYYVALLLSLLLVKEARLLGLAQAGLG